MNSTLYSLVGLAAGVAFILALKGLSHPKTARRGNLIGAFGATVATLSVFLYVTPSKGEESWSLTSTT
jgi:H+-translocating NAD(P) transhydrogenase subunit beta